MKPLSFKRHRSPAEMIRHVVWLYFRFSLSFENSHLPIRRHAHQQQIFKSQASAQRLLTIHTAIYNTCNIQRYLISRPTLHRLVPMRIPLGWLLSHEKSGAGSFGLCSVILTTPVTHNPHASRG